MGSRWREVETVMHVQHSDRFLCTLPLVVSLKILGRVVVPSNILGSKVGVMSRWRRIRLLVELLVLGEIVGESRSLKRLMLLGSVRRRDRGRSPLERLRLMIVVGR